MMAVSVLRGGRGSADFGPMLAVGTIAYMAGHFAFNYESLGNISSNAQPSFRSCFFMGPGMSR